MKSLPACMNYKAPEWWTAHLSSSHFAWLLVAVAVMYKPSATKEGNSVYRETFRFCNKLAVRVNSSFKPCGRNVDPSNSLRIPILSLCPHEWENRSWGRQSSQGQRRLKKELFVSLIAPEQTWAKQNLQIILQICLNLLELSDNLARVNKLLITEQYTNLYT